MTSARVCVAVFALTLVAGVSPAWAQAPGAAVSPTPVPEASRSSAPASIADATTSPAEGMPAAKAAPAMDGTASAESKPVVAKPARVAKDPAQNEAPSYLRQPAAPPERQPVAKKSEPDLTRIVIALALVLALGGVALFAKRRRDGVSPLKNQTRLHTLSSLSLGPKSKVALVSVGREALLLGVTEQGITCLRSYPEDELWSLTVPLPGFSEETSPSKAPPTVDKSWMERGMEGAFSDLLKRANKGEASSAQASDKKAPQARPANTTTAQEPADEFTPTALWQGRNSPAQPKQPKQWESDSTAELPPHLAALLRENALDKAGTEPFQPTTRQKVVPLRNRGDDTFGDPEGQAAELQRRFSEFSS